MMKTSASVSSGQGAIKKLRDIQAKLASQKEVLVGLPAASGQHPKSDLSIVQIGAMNEFGTKHIPERSFLRVPLRAAQPEFDAMFKKLIPRVIEGDLTFMQMLDMIGAKAASVSQEAISAGINPPNAPSTIARKGSSKPLIDTGRLRQAITWVISDKGIQ